jgi:hypothetical protein
VIILFFGSGVACWGLFLATDPTPEAISNLLISPSSLGTSTTVYVLQCMYHRQLPRQTCSTSVKHTAAATYPKLLSFDVLFFPDSQVFTPSFNATHKQAILNSKACSGTARLAFDSSSSWAHSSPLIHSTVKERISAKRSFMDTHNSRWRVVRAPVLPRISPKKTSISESRGLFR